MQKLALLFVVQDDSCETWNAWQGWGSKNYVCILTFCSYCEPKADFHLALGSFFWWDISREVPSKELFQAVLLEDMKITEVKELVSAKLKTLKEPMSEFFLWVFGSVSFVVC